MAKIVYHCYGGSHSSVTAAGIYLGMLPGERTAGAAELLGVPHYDRYEAVIHGRFRFIGRDIYGNEVFVLGKRTAGPDTTIFLYKIAELFGCGEEILPVDTTSPINPLMVVGGFLSRGLHLVSLGRPLVVCGTRMAYPLLAEIAGSVSQSVKERLAPVRRLPSLAKDRFLFYLCPENDLLPLLTAGLHLNPQIAAQELADWALQLQFSGKIGTLHFLGRVDHYRLYLAGGGGEAEIMGKILRGMRTLLGIPQVSLCIVQPAPGSSLLLKALSKLRKFLFLSSSKVLCKVMRYILIGFTQKCRREADAVRKSLLEGILD